jgi:hypothetical protein
MRKYQCSKINWVNCISIPLTPNCVHSCHNFGLTWRHSRQPIMVNNIFRKRAFDDIYSFKVMNGIGRAVIDVAGCTNAPASKVVQVRIASTGSVASPCSDDEAMLGDDFQPGNWHVVSYTRKCAEIAAPEQVSHSKFYQSVDHRYMAGKSATKNTLATRDCVS